MARFFVSIRRAPTVNLKRLGRERPPLQFHSDAAIKNVILMDRRLNGYQVRNRNSRLSMGAPSLPPVQAKEGPTL